MLHRALDLTKPGDIIAVDGKGCTNRAMMGERMPNYAEKRGIDGVVRDGNARQVCVACFFW